LLKEIPKEYTEELEYHKRTGYYTSSLILNTTMVFMPEILDSVPISENAEQRLITMGVSPEDATSWRQAYENYRDIEEKVGEFNDTCWSDIKRINDKSNVTSFRFVHEDLALLSMYTGGRILMNIGPKIMDGKFYISIVGDGSVSEGKEGRYRQGKDKRYHKGSRCGFQGIHAKKEEAIEYVDTIMENWDKDKYCEHENRMSIC